MKAKARRRLVLSSAEWGLAVLAVVLYFSGGGLSGGSSTPLKAHEFSESTFHYGPSSIVREVRFDSSTVIYLCTYKTWFSADTVLKKGYRWFPGGGVSGVMIDAGKPLSYSWEVSQVNKKLRLAKWYGYVTDPQIATVVLNMEAQGGTQGEEGKAVELRQPVKEDRMFLFAWNQKGPDNVWKSIRGLSRDGKVIYEQKLD